MHFLVLLLILLLVLFFLILILILFFSILNHSSNFGDPMKILAGGIMHESNTFAATPADRKRFAEGSFAVGDAIIPIWKDAHHEFGGFIEGSRRIGFELIPSVMAWATPSGPVDDAVLDEAVNSNTYS